MLRHIFEVPSRAWSEISQLQHKTESHQVLGGALLFSACGSRACVPPLWPAWGQAGGLLCSRGQVVSLELWAGGCTVQSGLCFPGKTDRAVRFLLLPPEVLRHGRGHIWIGMVQPGDLAEMFYLSLKK